MIRIEIGGAYKCFRFRYGNSDKGPWEIATVAEFGKNGRTSSEVTIFPTKVPSGLYEGCQFVVRRILNVTRKKAKDRNGEWTLTDVCITADVELEKDELNLDGDLPFTFGDYDSGEDAVDMKDLLGPAEITDLL